MDVFNPITAEAFHSQISILLRCFFNCTVTCCPKNNNKEKENRKKKIVILLHPLLVTGRCLRYPLLSFDSYFSYQQTIVSELHVPPRRVVTTENNEEHGNYLTTPQKRGARGQMSTSQMKFTVMSEFWDEQSRRYWQLFVLWNLRSDGSRVTLFDT